jgi:putative transposase
MLVALGIKADGKKEIIDFRQVAGESKTAWEGFLNHLYQRGLQGEALKLVVVDGGKGLLAALDLVYGQVPLQRCWAHSVPRRAQTRRMQCSFPDNTSESGSLGQMVAA